MSERQQSVRTFEPSKVERFDDQFWPILMAMCITATILAATIMTLMAGFWMWVSLMVLPAAITLLLVTLRFVDNKRLRRSLQLAMILSLAVHCLFIIFAHQTSVFSGFFTTSRPVTTVARQPRVIQVTQQFNDQKWQLENETESVEVVETKPERTTEATTATTRPQPTQAKATQATNSQQMQRQQTSQTVPRHGESLSRLSRQTANEQPRSSEKVEQAKPAPDNPTATSSPSKVMESEPTLTRRSSSSSASRSSRRPTREPSSSQSTSRRANESARRSRSESRETPSMAARKSTASKSKRNTSTPTSSEKAPSRVVNAPQPAKRPTSRPAASKPSDSSRMTRRTPSRPQSQTARMHRNESSASRSNSLARETTRKPQADTSPSVTQRQPTLRRSRTTTNSELAASPESIERPREATSVSQSGESQMAPQPTALKRSTNGTSGVGRTANSAREAGSRQSSAMVASDSMRRKQATTRQNDAESIVLREMSRTRGTIASKDMPSVVQQPDSIAMASQTASSQPAELTASSSASLTRSNAEAKRGDTSVAKGTGNADIGPQKVVSTELTQRSEGGGQPTVQNRPTTRNTRMDGDTGSSAPSIQADSIASIAADPAGGSTSETSELSNEMAEAELNSRSGDIAHESGRPSRSDNSRMDRAITDATELAESNMGRAGHDSDSDDEEEERRRRERAEQLARNSRSRTGSDAPSVNAEIEQIAMTSDSSGESSVPASARPGDSFADDTYALLDSRSESSGESESGISRNAAASPQQSDAVGQAQQLAGRAKGSSDQPQASSSTSSTGNRQTSVPDGIASTEQPQSAGQVAVATGHSNQVSDDSSMANLNRNAPAGMAFKIDAESGPAGLGKQFNSNPGLNSRRSSRDSPSLQATARTRFIKRESGGAPSINSAPLIAKEGFQNRQQPSRSGAPTTEVAIERGLAFLARHQQEDGSWTLHGLQQDRVEGMTVLNSDMAATGLAILAFQGAGYNHKEFKYASQLQAAINWMVENQKQTGELYVDSDAYSNNSARFYSHGIASLALAEAYGMTQDEEIMSAAQIALDYISDTQHPRLGGWRYRMGTESDTSVTGWMMMAMQSGRLAELETDEKTWQGIDRWLSMARSPSQEHLFRYNPEAADNQRQRHGRDVSPCMTAVGLLMHVYLGWDRQDPRLIEGADYIMQNLPNDETVNTRDTYYWYYSTQIIRHVGGEQWEKWHSKLHPLLVESQVKENEISVPWSTSFQESNDLAGSWDPLNPVPDRWGAQAGRLYVTTMNLLSLEVDYRLLPLHDATVK